MCDNLCCWLALDCACVWLTASVPDYYTQQYVTGFVLSGSYGLFGGDKKLFRAKNCLLTCAFTCFTFYKYSLSPCLTPSNLFNAHMDALRQAKRRSITGGKKNLGGNSLKWAKTFCQNAHTHTCSNTQCYTPGHIHNGTLMSESCGDPVSSRFTPAHGSAANQPQSIK